MAMVMMAMRPMGRLGQVLNVRQSVVLRSALEIGRELIELVGLGAVAVGSSRLSGILEIRGDLRCHLLVFGWIGLLQLL